MSPRSCRNKPAADGVAVTCIGNQHVEGIPGDAFDLMGDGCFLSFDIRLLYPYQYIDKNALIFTGAAIIEKFIYFKTKETKGIGYAEKFA
ncbi:MAG: hypothetical protein WAM61_13085 [Desulfobacterales bacterium]